MFARLTVIAACLVAIFSALPPTRAANPADGQKLDIQLKEVKKQSTLVIKKTAKRDEIGPTLAEILPQVFGYIGANNIKPDSAPMAKYKVAGEKYEMEGGLIVPTGTKGSGEIVAGELPAGKAAFAVHVGAYEKLPDTYKAMADWLKAKGLKPSNVGWEIYVTDPSQAKPDEIKTEVYLLVEPEKKSK
jgi:effector-binding domain-containing protein